MHDFLFVLIQLLFLTQVLSKHNSSLLQTDSAEMTGNVMPNIAVMLKHLTTKYQNELSGTIAPSQQRAINEFIAVPQ
jgi:hypothetical protein